jgi:dCMP deaminase
MKKRKSWDQYFLGLAKEIGHRSKDESVRIGAMVVDPDKNPRCTGYNGFPRRVNDAVPERHVRPQKYFWTVHAEANAIYHAARMGVSTKGCTLYVCSDEYPLPPCAVCAQAIIQSGIAKVVYVTAKEIPERWQESIDVAATMLKEAGVETVQIFKKKRKKSGLPAQKS